MRIHIKPWLFLLLFCFFFSCQTGSSLAASAPISQVSSSGSAELRLTASQTAPDRIVAEISLNSSKPVSGLQFTLTYDSNLLTLCEAPSGILSGGNYTINSSEPGMIYVVWYGNNGKSLSIEPEIALLSLSFSPLGSGEAQISLSREATLSTLVIDEDLLPLTDTSTQTSIWIDLTSSAHAEQIPPIQEKATENVPQNSPIVSPHKEQTVTRSQTVADINITPDHKDSALAADPANAMHENAPDYHTEKAYESSITAPAPQENRQLTALLICCFLLLAAIATGLLFLHKKRLLTFCLACILGANLVLPASAAAVSLETPVYSLGYLGDEMVAPSLSDDWYTSAQDTGLPESFDLRNVDGSNYMTPVRNQNPYNTCWAHAVVSSMESNLLLQGYSGHEDLSELQLIYYTYNRNSAIADAGGGTSGDLASILDKTVTGNNALQAGGNSEHAISALSAGLGFIPESALPYPDSYSESAYSPSEHALTVMTGTLDNSYARSKNTVAFDHAYILNTDSDAGIIKSLLMTNGAATISYFYDDYYDCDTGYYQNVQTSTNHAVTLCGWDDNYAASNFSGAATPSSDGAWLCKNSWGTWYGNNGYFWLSYEDPSISANAYFIGGKPAAQGYDNLYQYDGGFANSYVYYGTNSIYGANRFTAEKNETLKAVRLSLYDVNTSVTIRVYTHLTSQTDPTRGTLVGTTEAFCPYTGTYTIPLDTPIELAQGETFSIVVKQTVPSGTANLLYDRSYSDGVRTSTVTALPGQSFMSYNGSSWIDMAADLGNARIKALTDIDSGTGVPGDVNQDGVLGISDAVLISRYLTNLETLRNVQQTAANIDGDQAITVADIIRICRILAGTDTQP